MCQDAARKVNGLTGGNGQLAPRNVEMKRRVVAERVVDSVAQVAQKLGAVETVLTRKTVIITTVKVRYLLIHLLCSSVALQLHDKNVFELLSRAQIPFSLIYFICL